MKTVVYHEYYPIWVIMMSNLVSLAIYVLGFIIIYRFGLSFALLYLGYVLAIEYRLIRYHCIDCYYWGRTCGFGKGRISVLFFNRGDATKFCMKDASWKEMIPGLLISLIPLTGGIFLLISKFDVVLLVSMVLLLGLTTAGNGYIRGQLTCKYCKQRELGCPAHKLFNKSFAQ